MKKMEIISLYKHNIVHKNTKNKQLKLFVYSLIVCLVCVFSYSYLYAINNDVKNSVAVFNPISELYRDVEVASFVSSGNVNFIVPIKTESYKIKSDAFWLFFLQNVPHLNTLHLLPPVFFHPPYLFADILLEYPVCMLAYKKLSLHFLQIIVYFPLLQNPLLNYEHPFPDYIY